MVTGVTCESSCTCDIKPAVPTQILAEAFAGEGNVCADPEEGLEFHKLCSPGDQLQDRLLRRRVGWKNHEPSVHLPENCRTAERQDDLAGDGDRPYAFFRFSSPRSRFRPRF